MSRTTAKTIAGDAIKSTGKALTLNINHNAHRPDPDLIQARRFKRITGFVLDGLLLPVFAALIPFMGLGFALLFAYMSFKGNIIGSGRSLGRAAMGQRLLARDGTDASHGLVMARNAVRFLLWMAVLPFFIDVGLLLFGDGRLLTDRIFGTRVFEDPEKVRADRLLESEQVQHHVAAEAARWDERYEQDELESIAGELDGDPDAELLAFERRIGTANTVAIHDPFLAELAAEPVEAAPQPEVIPAEAAVVETHRG